MRRSAVKIALLALHCTAALFAGGDAVTGAATVILAMGAGKQAAAKIKEFLGK